MRIEMDAKDKKIAELERRVAELSTSSDVAHEREMKVDTTA